MHHSRHLLLVCGTNIISLPQVAGFQSPPLCPCGRRRLDTCLVHIHLPLVLSCRSVEQAGPSPYHDTISSPPHPHIITIACMLKACWRHNETKVSRGAIKALPIRSVYLLVWPREADGCCSRLSVLWVCLTADTGVSWSVELVCLGLGEGGHVRQCISSKHPRLHNSTDHQRHRPEPLHPQS